MKKDSPARNAPEKIATWGPRNLQAMRNLFPRRSRIAHTFYVSLLLIAVALLPTVSPFAQKRNDRSYKVTEVSSRKTGEGTVVSLSADSALTRTQTWQDDEGFHMSLPGASAAGLKALPRGVTVRNLGKTLEVVVAVKPGAGVTVDPRFNRLNLIIRGDVSTARGEAQLEPPTQIERSKQTVNYEQPIRQPRERRVPAETAPLSSAPSGEKGFTLAAPMPANSSAPLAPQPQGPYAAVSPATSQPSTASPSASPLQLVPVTDDGIRPAGSDSEAVGTDLPSEIKVSEPQSGGIFSFLTSTTGFLMIMLLGLIAFVLVRRRQAAQDVIVMPAEETPEAESLEEPPVAHEQATNDRRKGLRRQIDQDLVKGNSAEGLEGDVRAGTALDKRAAVPAQPALFGAYRVDQEVGKLVLGQAHRMDVLSSRSPDDRRALETSLLKAMKSAEAGEDGCRRARLALEDYGFVARQCASLLLANNAHDRASAARALGEIGAKSSLPFLLEALYDTETIVRTEAVASLGTLKMPSAIGALLDMARRHPEMPSTLLSRALSACSVECFDIFDSSLPNLPLLELGEGNSFPGEITHLDSSVAVEALPEWFDNEELAETLARLEDENMETRAGAARKLAQFPVQRSVVALTTLVTSDPEFVVRSAAVTSLGEIEHESVFSPVLTALADEAREVRAAAARSLSRLSFDRSEGYVRLIEAADPESLRNVANACIKAGMVGQAIDRMVSEDRRLAYEAFSLLSLLAKANEIEPLLHAISDHPEMGTRLALIRLLGTTGRPEVATQLRHLALREGMPEKVRTALMEVVYKIDQTQPV